MPVFSFIPCTHPASQVIVLSLLVCLTLSLLIGRKSLSGKSILAASSAAAALILLALWLGSYPFSPLSLAGGRIPVLRGFTITTRNLPGVRLAPGAIVSLASGQAASIVPDLLLPGTRCNWSSAKGGSLDSQDDCDMIYTPPQGEYDILRVHIQPGCGLPTGVADIKISILP